MSQPAEDLIRWVRGRLVDITADGSVSRFELWHSVDGDHPERLQTIILDEDNTDADVLAETLWDISEHDAATRTLGMRQRYVALSYRGDMDESDSRHPWTIVSTSMGGGVGATFSGDTEMPNEKGGLAHFMRHDTQMHGLMMQMTESMAGRAMRDIQMLQRRAESAERAAMSLFETQQALLDRKQERDIEMAHETAKMKRHEDMMAIFMSMAPLLLAKFMGGNVGTNARDVAVGKILESLTEEELTGIMKTLRPVNQLALMELFKSHKEDRDKMMEGRHPILRDTPPDTDEEAEDPRH